jgi:transposase
MTQLCDASAARFKRRYVDQESIILCVRTLRASFKLEVEWGRQNACPQTAATGRALLLREAAVWTCVQGAGSEPPHNASARSLRGAGWWRKVSFGTQSERGSRFVASLLTVFLSCHQQQRNALISLTACGQAFYATRPVPSLIP